ncbi:L-threonylcarbamoyladenylate synthase [Sporosarcina thermotolerans]|uniref:Threonylcarbamoyl-AMP synthase n=1 Tax=Sporosarcina thermotolerans TaxID=633404 RepID=A0AAW9A6Y2_9BACL|nr:L-threonylcarbamoyladenylate synthase [Sporosarcina thermotolerans]MDW0116393.1 L-threonylcarbamoyladenylate synthase [Sporosarcina thermotolerans]
MDTEIISVDNHVGNFLSYQRAVDILKNGGVVAFPTETVYGLGAVATDANAVQKIFDAKGRPSDNPLIVHIGNKKDVDKYAVDVPDDAKKLMDAYWPGPLTLVFNKRPGVIAENVTPGFETVGIRMPDHPVALELLQKLDMPLAAPSANRSGKPSPTEANHVFTDLQGRIPLIVDGGRTGVGVESTVLDMTTVPPTILRPGGLTREMIEELIGHVHAESEVSKGDAPKAPGMKYMHYAPESPLYIIQADEKVIQDAVNALHNEGKRVAVIGPDEFRVKVDEADWYFSVGPLHDQEALATNLYGAIRQCDLTEADIILAAETEWTGVGAAVMNRLVKAADGKRYLL